MKQIVLLLATWLADVSIKPRLVMMQSVVRVATMGALGALLSSCATPYQPPPNEKSIAEAELTKLAEFTVPKSADVLYVCRDGAPLSTVASYLDSPVIALTRWACIDFNPDGETFAIGPMTKGGGAELRRMSDGGLVETFSSAAPPQFSRDGRYLIFGGGIEYFGTWGTPRYGTALEIWDLRNARWTANLNIGRFKQGYVTNKTSSVIAIQTTRGADLVGLPGLSQIGAVPRSDSSNVVFSPDGKFVASAVGKNISVIGMDRMQLVRELSDNAPVQNLAFSHDSRQLVGVNYKGRFTMWRIDNGQQVAGLGEDMRMFENVIKDLEFSADNRHLLSVVRSFPESMNKTAVLFRAWRIEDGSLVAAYSSPQEASKDSRLGYAVQREWRNHALIHPELGVLFVTIEPAGGQTDPEQRTIKVWRHEAMTRLLG